MLYKVAVPVLPPQVREATVERWHVAEGGTIQFGDPVCDLLVSHNYKTVRQHRANRLRRSSGASDVMTKSTDIRVRILSNDRAVLRAIAAPVGTEVQEGAVLGLAASDDTEAVGGEPTLELRLLAEMMAQADNTDDDAWEDLA
jgi:pyruvate/2-oxoglutarate dehydrogenase complex dihydrolipoamide acyltransferase (E2) component